MKSMATEFIELCHSYCILQVLMIRLSFQTPLDYSLLVSWLTLMHDYFGELLRQPITSLESVRDDCLEGSPFVMSVSDTEGKELCSLHLQRLAIFLFLRCSLSLISLMCGTDEKCPCATRKICFPYEPNEKLDCCGRKKGLLELYNWLQGHVPVDMFVDYKTYLQKCVDFALSFLQLYIREVCHLASLNDSIPNLHIELFAYEIYLLVVFYLMDWELHDILRWTESSMFFINECTLLLCCSNFPNVKL